MNIVIDSILTNYQSFGKGPIILVLHGWGDDSTGWQSTTKPLADRYKIIIPDLPGFGKTEAPPAAWGLNEYAAFVAAFLQKLEIKHVYAMIGHSNGGAIAIRGLGTDVLSTNRLVLLSSAGIRNQRKGRVKLLRYVTKAGKQLTSLLPKRIQAKLRQKLYTSVGSDMLVVEGLQESFRKIVSDDVRSDAANLSLPTLMLYGQADVATPPAYGRLLHDRIAESEMHEIQSAGHFIHYDAPEEVQKYIQEFLNA